jgi:hypothetical protein
VKHKCADCGFLAVRNIYSRGLEEAEKTFRDTGAQPTTVTHNTDGTLIIIGSYEDEPLCFMQACNLKKEFYKPLNSSVPIVLHEDRECDEFTEWQQGSSPKEHREMMDRKEMLKWQADREDADKKWREQQEQKHSTEEWHRYIFVGILGIVAVIIGVILGHYWK